MAATRRTMRDDRDYYTYDNINVSAGKRGIKMKKSDKKTALALVGVVLVIVVLIWLGFSGFKDDVYTTITPIEQSDTRIQQDIYLKASPYDNEPDKKYYIHTYIEVYNSGWEEAKSWGNYATAEETADIKAKHMKLAEKASVKIGKAIREFYYGKGN